MKRTLTLALVACSLGVGALSACSASVGDSCEIQTDCGRGMYCERSLPGGYCTRKDCDRQGCPENGVCVVFEPDVSFCMQACDDTADCRSDENYICIKDYGPHPFCNVPDR